MKPFSRKYNPEPDPTIDTLFQAFVVVFANPESQDIYRTFEYFWNISFITDVVAISYLRQEPCVSIYSYQPFTQTSCRAVTIEKLHGLCRNDSKTQLNLFPRIITNLHKCIVRGSSSTGKYASNFHEENCLNLLSNKINFTFLITRKDLKSEELFDMTYFDLAFGANILTEERIRFMSPSYPQSSKNLHLFVRYEETLKTSLEILLEPFQWTLWLALIVCSSIGTTLLTFSKRSPILDESMTMMCMLLGITTKLPSKRFAVRVQYFCWMCLGFMISATHHAIFFNIMKLAMLKPLPKTLEEVLKKNYVEAILVPRPIGDHMSEYLRRFTNIEVIVARVHGIIPAVLHGEKRVLGVTTGSMVAFSGEDFRSLHFLEDKVSSFFSAIFFKKNSFLLRPFNKMVMQLYCGGIIQKWRNDFFDRIFDVEKELRGFKVLGLTELGGIFQIWLIILSVSCCLVLAEIVYSRRT